LIRDERRCRHATAKTGNYNRCRKTVHAFHEGFLVTGLC
jgi:hypothetical protein